MPEPLPRRRGRPPEPLWLPALGGLVADEPLNYRLGTIGPKGEAWLHAWEATGGGCFAVVSWIEGLDLAEVARPLRYTLAERFGPPFALAELSAAGVDLVLPPEPGEDQGWLRLWPAEADGPLRERLDAWWGEHGNTVLSA